MHLASDEHLGTGTPFSHHPALYFLFLSTGPLAPIGCGPRNGLLLLLSSFKLTDLPLARIGSGPRTGSLVLTLAPTLFKKLTLLRRLKLMLGVND